MATKMNPYQDARYHAAMMAFKYHCSTTNCSRHAVNVWDMKPLCVLHEPTAGPDVRVKTSAYL